MKHRGTKIADTGRRALDRAFACIVAYLFTLSTVFPAYANPQGGAVSGGSATISTNGNTATITQSSDRAVIDWNSFNIGSGETTRFIQPSPSSLAVNRVNDINPSHIFGTLTANGNIVLINPNGVFFAPGSQVDVNGLIATTSNVSTAEVMAGGKLHFMPGGNPNASVINQGTITAAQAGLVGLVAPNVLNNGIINARLGKVQLASGDSFTLDLYGDGLMEISLSDAVSQQLVQNSGVINAAGGTVQLTAAAGRQIVNSLIDVEGEIHTPAFSQHNGEIDIYAAGSNSGQWPDDSRALVDISGTVQAASGKVAIAAKTLSNTGNITVAATDQTQSGGSISIDAKNVANQGSILADGLAAGTGGSVAVNFSGAYIDSESSLISAQNGGSITLTGGVGSTLFSSGTYDVHGVHGAGGAIDVLADTIKLYAAQLNAGGDTGGGRIRIGGGWQGGEGLLWATDATVNATTVLMADALNTGNGGRISIWSSDQTRFDGTATAKGGPNGGDGGNIEISSHDTLTIGQYSIVDASSPLGANGNVLLDPHNITIANTGIASGSLSYYEFTDPNADTGTYGTAVLTLSSGNVVIADAGDDFVATNTGAVYLFNGATGALISTLRGVTAQDQVGSTVSGTGSVKALTGNGNFIVASGLWVNGATVDAGAVTWCSGSTGCSGSVTTSNSLYGTHTSDKVGAAVFNSYLLSNGNYVVLSPLWDNGATADVGAATWINGSNGKTVNGNVGEAVGTTNSLYGGTASDCVGSVNCSLIANAASTPLTNGNYVVISSNWHNGATAGAGAVTWGDGANGTTGAVSTSNSLYGSTASDNVGSINNTMLGFFALTNGNYVVISSDWHNGATAGAGAATWINGSNGHTVNGNLGEAVGTTNSLYGSTANDYVGSVNNTQNGFMAFTNGNYAVVSSNWHNGATASAGAVTFGCGSSSNACGANGITGAVSTSNSLYGSTANDQVGSTGTARSVLSLTNGNYVVLSPLWDNGATADVGAVTWINGSNGHTVNGNLGEAVGTTNSLYGSTASDQVGSVSPGIALTNGNYVVDSPLWDNGGTADVGAATWGNGSSGTTGAVSTANSLYGTHASDKVGGIAGVSLGIVALTNGKYVVESNLWDNGATADAGAVTWINGSNGHTVNSNLGEAVGTTNSLYGSTASDKIGSINNGAILSVRALTNGNYVVGSPLWDNGATANVGAVTWGNGSSGTTGAVSTANSLYGSTASDQVGGAGPTGVLPGILALSNGNYAVASSVWDNGGTADAGAVTLCSGTAGCSGTISAANSMLGPSASSALNALVEDTVNGTVIAHFNTAQRVFAVRNYTSPNGATYSFAPSSDVTFAPSFLTAVLNTGSSVTLQANNDITVTNAVTASNSGAGGALTLDAGRSILINANITTDGGALTLLANDTAADGVVNANRDSGNAVITMASGTTLNSGAGAMNITIGTGAGNTNTGSGDITFYGLTSGALTVANNGPSHGNITFNNALTLGGTGSVTTAGGNVTFSSTIDDSTTNTDALTVNAGSGTVTFTGNVGSTKKLASLTVTGSTTIDGNVTTGGAQAYNSAVTLGAADTLTTTNGNVTFGSTLDGSASHYDLTVAQGSGITTFTGAVGSSTSLGALSVSGSGGITLDANVTTANQSIAFNGAVTLGASSIINSGTALITTGSTLAGSTYNLTLTADDLALGGNFSGTGALTLQPYTNSTILRLNDGAGGFNVSSTELGYINSGSFSSVTYGNSSNTGGINIGAISEAANTSFLSNSGNITFDGIQTLGTKTLTGVTTSGNITLAQDAKIVSTANSGNSIVLAAGGNFANNDSNDGAGALVAGTGTARYLVYSTSPVNDTFNGISPTHTHYSGTYGSYAPGSVTESGNVFIYNSAAGTITVTANNQSITYGDSLPSLTYNYSCSNGCAQGATLATGPTLTIGGTQSTSLNYIAGNHTISAAASLSGGYNGYTLTLNSGTLAIAQKGLTISGFAVNNKTYDGLTTTTISANGSLSGVVTNDLVSLNSGSASASFDNANVSTTHTVTASGYTLGNTDAGNYTLTQPTATNVTISARGLTITASDQTHTYGFGSLGTTGFTSSGLQNSETIGGVTLTTNDATSTSGNYKATSSPATITPSAATGGTFSASNYSITYNNAPTGLTVNKATLTISGFAASNKTYDSTTSATISSNGSLSGVVSGDSVSQNSGSASATFDNASVGTTHTVTASGYAISGTDSGNYTLTQPTASNVTISAAGVTITASDQTHTYGFGSLGSSGYTITSGTLYGSDAISGVTLATNDGTSTSGNYNATSSAATITPSAAVFSSGSSGNYAITYANAPTGLTVNKATLTLTGFAVNNKTYDSTTAATITSNGSLSGVAGADSVSLNTGSASAAFDNANVGTTHTVTASGYALGSGNGNADAGNYTLTQPTASNVTISAAGIAITASDQTHTYGFGSLGSTGFSITSGQLFGTDAISGVTLATNDGTSTSGNYKATSSPATLTPSAAVFSSGSSSNYAITYSNAGTGLTVNKATLTLSGFAANNKTYDGTTNATISNNGSLSGVVSGDSVNLNSGSASATFDNANAGTTHTVTASGYSLASGNGNNDAGNYTLAQPTASNVTISAAGITITASDQTYTYGFGSLGITGYSITSGQLFGSDAISGVTLSTNDGTSTSGNYKATSGPATITPSAAVFGSGSTSNYAITYANAPTGLTVNKATLTINGFAVTNKTYDGTTNATISGNGTLAGTVGGDQVSLDASGASAAFDNKNVGTTHTVTASSYGLASGNGNADAGNYTLTQPAASNVTISPKALTLTADAQSAIYGDTLAALTYSNSGLAAGDSFTGTLITAHGGVGTVLKHANGFDVSGSPFAITQGTLLPSDGNGGANYSITYNSANLTLAAKDITITGFAAGNKTYDGNTNASITSDGSLSGTVAGDTVSINNGGASATFDNKHAGTTHTVTATGYALAGAQAGDYSLSAQPTASNVTISQKALTVTADAQSAIYGDTLAALTYGTSGLAAGDSFTGTLTTAHGGAGTVLKHANGFDVSGSPFAITQGTLNNTDYAITYNGANFTLAAKTLTDSGFAVNNKTYDGTTPAAISANGSLSGMVSGDSVALNSGSASAAFDNANVGTTHTVTASGYVLAGAQASDYSLTQPTATNATISARGLNITASDQTQTYGFGSLGTTSFTSTGLQNGETIGGVTLATNDGTSTSGNYLYTASPATITPSAATGGSFNAGNYSISYANAITGLTVNKAGLTITGFAAGNKPYDGTTAATISSNGSLLGLVGSDSVSLNSGSASATFDNANVGTTHTVTASGYTLTSGNGNADANNYTLTQPAATNVTISVVSSGGGSPMTDGGTFTLPDTVAVTEQNPPAIYCNQLWDQWSPDARRRPCP